KRSKERRRKKERGYPNSRARPPRSGDCDSVLAQFPPQEGTEVDCQVAAPTKSSTPNLHRATIAQQRVRMEGWRQRRLGTMETIWKKKKQRRTKKKMKEEP